MVTRVFSLLPVIVLLVDLADFMSVIVCEKNDLAGRKHPVLLRVGKVPDFIRPGQRLSVASAKKNCFCRGGRRGELQPKPGDAAFTWATMRWGNFHEACWKFRSKRVTLGKRGISIRRKVQEQVMLIFEKRLGASGQLMVLLNWKRQLRYGQSICIWKVFALS